MNDKSWKEYAFRDRNGQLVHAYCDGCLLTKEEATAIELQNHFEFMKPQWARDKANVRTVIYVLCN